MSLKSDQGIPTQLGLEDSPSVEAFTESTFPSFPWHFDLKERHFLEFSHCKYSTPLGRRSSSTAWDTAWLSQEQWIIKGRENAHHEHNWTSWFVLCFQLYILALLGGFNVFWVLTGPVWYSTQAFSLAWEGLEVPRSPFHRHIIKDTGTPGDLQRARQCLHSRAPGLHPSRELFPARGPEGMLKTSPQAAEGKKDWWWKSTKNLWYKLVEEEDGVFLALWAGGFVDSSSTLPVSPDRVWKGLSWKGLSWKDLSWVAGGKRLSLPLCQRGTEEQRGGKQEGLPSRDILLHKK